MCGDMRCTAVVEENHVDDRQLERSINHKLLYFLRYYKDFVKIIANTTNLMI